MVFEQIDRIKREYTDKYVLVDDRRPELARFKGVVGHVKTVNMSGRALVEFLEFHKNIGWYDIDIDYLKVVDKPAPPVKGGKERPKPAAKKPVAAKAGDGTKKLSPLEMARMQGAAKKKETAAAGPSPASATPDTGATSAGQPAATKKGGKRSVADILAAARGEKVGATSKEMEKPSPAAPVGPPAAKPESSKSPAKTGEKMSVADILEAARAEKEAATTNAAPAESASVEPSTPPTTPESTDATEPAPTAAAGSDKVDRASMSVADMIAWCREHDG